MATQPSFYDTLQRVTGTERIGGEVCLIGQERKGHAIFINSGVLPMKEIPLTFGSLAVGGQGLHGNLQTGPRVYISNLVMDERSPPEHWHVHPMGELTIVKDGSYYDDGGHRYVAGDWVWYNQQSSHRPMVGERAGDPVTLESTADLSYITLSGLVRVDNMKPFEIGELLAKAAKAGIKEAPDALDFLLRSVVSDPAERRRLMDSI